VIRRPAPTLRARALMWLSQREHSRLELRAKLRRWAGDPDVAPDEVRPTASDAEIDALLDELVAAKHLSDGRFVESRVHARQARFGNRRILQELRQNGVAPDEHVSAHLRETEIQRAFEVHARKFGAAPRTPQDRARQMRFLAARGFTAETIRKVLRDDEA
jgi:regulatory protein